MVVPTDAAIRRGAGAPMSRIHAWLRGPCSDEARAAVFAELKRAAPSTRGQVQALLEFGGVPARWVTAVQEALRGVAAQQERRQVLRALARDRWMNAGVLALQTGLSLKATLERLLQLRSRGQIEIRNWPGHRAGVSAQLMFRRR